MEAAIEGMLSKLDQYSNYIDPEEVENFRRGVESEFSGIGIQISLEGGRLTVLSPIVGTPAYQAGLKPGDQIMKIEGEDTKGITIDDAVSKLKGKIGTSVTLTVRHVRDNSTETVKLERDKVRVETVLGDHRTDDDQWDYMYDAEKKIGYIRVTTFGRHTVEELQESMRQLKEKDLNGLILDLRFNPGGLLSAAIDISDMFLTEGTIVSTEGRNIAKRSWSAKKRDTYSGFPMAVLVNRYSASASEIVSAALQDHDRVVVVGERTWGKGSVQNIVELEKGRSALKLTTAGYLRPSGKNIHKFDGATDADEWGVMPDEGYRIKLDGAELGQLLNYQRSRILLNRETEGSKPQRSYVDKQFQKALDYVSEQLAAKQKEAEGEEKAAQAEDEAVPAAG
jgi:carboxyl-terminal processing protease